MIHFEEIVIGLDGKRYKENGAMSSDIESKHKKSCWKNGIMYSRDEKINGVIYNICTGCNYKCVTNIPAGTFPENEILK